MLTPTPIYDLIGGLLLMISRPIAVITHSGVDETAMNLTIAMTLAMFVLGLFFMVSASHFLRDLIMKEVRKWL